MRIRFVEYHVIDDMHHCRGLWFIGRPPDYYDTAYDPVVCTVEHPDFEIESNTFHISGFMRECFPTPNEMMTTDVEE